MCVDEWGTEVGSSRPRMMWYYEINGGQHGPVEADEIHRRLNSGELSAATLIWREGMANWMPLGQVPDLTRTQSSGGMMPQPQPGQPMNPAMMQPGLNGLALGSMITGLLSLLMMVMCVGGLFGIPAVILGHMGRSQIRRNPVPQSGDGLAITGLITGYLSIVLTIGFVIASAVGISRAAKAIPTMTPTVLPTPASPSSSPSPALIPTELGPDPEQELDLEEL